MTWTEDARAHLVPCGACWTLPGAPCGPGWDHLARYFRANRRGFISHAELQRLVHASVELDCMQIVRFDAQQLTGAP
jgi:hypothetical protein